MNAIKKRRINSNPETRRFHLLPYTSENIYKYIFYPILYLPFSPYYSEWMVLQKGNNVRRLKIN